MIDGLCLHVRTERQVVPQKEVGIEIVGRCSLGETDDGIVRKAEYITDFAARVRSGAFDLDGIRHRSDEEAIRALTALRGVGVWTAEMMLLFCMQRPDVFSYDDLAIQRGLRMIYHHRKIDRRLFEKYRRRFSPCCSVASLYLWAAAGGAVPELRDYAPAKRAAARRSADRSREHGA